MTILPARVDSSVMTGSDDRASLPPVVTARWTSRFPDRFGDGSRLGVDLAILDCREAVLAHPNAPTYRDAPLEYGRGESWDKLVHQGVHLLHLLAQDDRNRIRRPKQNLQLKLIRSLANGNGFLSYIDAMGQIGRCCSRELFPCLCRTRKRYF